MSQNTKNTSQRTPAQIRREIISKTRNLKDQISQITGIEAGFALARDELEKLVKEYNSSRLDKLISQLTSKHLGYCPSCKKLVPENVFQFREEHGTHTVTRNTYYDYDEPYHYRYYRCDRCGKSIGYSKKGARAAWVEAFKRDFANATKDQLPQEIILALPESVLPNEPIKFSDWNEWGSEHSTRFSNVRYFFVRGPGICVSGWTTDKERW